MRHSYVHFSNFPDVFRSNIRVPDFWIVRGIKHVAHKNRDVSIVEPFAYNLNQRHRSLPTRRTMHAIHVCLALASTVMQKHSNESASSTKTFTRCLHYVHILFIIEEVALLMKYGKALIKKYIKLLGSMNQKWATRNCRNFKESRTNLVQSIFCYNDLLPWNYRLRTFFEIKCK